MNSEECAGLDIARYRDPKGAGSTLLSAGSLAGKLVVNRDGERLGKIKELMLNTANGSMCYAVLSSGGFLGIGERLFAVPWRALVLDCRQKRFVLDVIMTRFKVAPGFDKHEWPAIADTNWTHAAHGSQGMPRAGSRSGDSVP